MACDGAGNKVDGSEPYRFGAGGKEPSSFTWFESYTDAMMELDSREEQIRFVMGLIGYGAYGVDPMFTEPSLKPLFKIVKPFMDTNKKRVSGGKKGGSSKAD